MMRKILTVLFLSLVFTLSAFSYSKEFNELYNLYYMANTNKADDLNKNIEKMKTLLDNMQKDAERIAAQLPESWKQYYLHGPEPYLSAKAWTGALNMLSVIPQIIAIRLPVEIPTTPDEWQTAALRGLLMLHHYPGD